jgi:ribosomal protein S6
MQKEMEEILGIVKPREREEELKKKVEQCCTIIKQLEENLSK